MLTTSSFTTVSEVPVLTQNETAPSDLEVSRRVFEIRSSWSLTERVHRRREAERRIADLLDSLSVDCDAA